MTRVLLIIGIAVTVAGILYGLQIAGVPSGWVFASLVIGISTVTIAYGVKVTCDAWADYRNLADREGGNGKHGILTGLTWIAFESDVRLVVSVALFQTAGWIVMGVLLAGAPPEGKMLMFSRSVTLVNLSLTAFGLWRVTAGRRALVEQVDEGRI